jgi:aryl-alcohol dehydrogenase-like predicted oxidoreductase
LLSGKYDHDYRFSGNDRRHRLSHFAPAEMKQHLKVVSSIRELAARTGHTAAQMAIGFVLAQPVIAAAIVGAKTEAQVDQNTAALQLASEAGDIPAKIQLS